MFGAILAGAKALGSTLARAGIIRGTLGKVLGGTTARTVAGTVAGTVVGAMIPSMGAQPQIPQLQLPQMGLTTFRPGVGMVAAGVGGGLVAAGGQVVQGVTRRYGKKIMALLASGLLFEAGGKLWNAVTGQEHKTGRRMNYSNMRALKRGIRRVEGASKQYARILRATQGGVKKCGYTVKPKKSRRGCA